MIKVGLMGGTFNPIHNAHLIVANEVLNQLHLDKIIFIPNAQPPKVENKSTTASSKDRLNMIQLAIMNNPDLVISDIEIKRGGQSYTYDTVKALTDHYPHVQFYLIIGGDEVKLLPKWYRINDLVHMVKIVGVNRTNYSNHSIYPIINVKIPRFDISSTLIRNRINHNQTVKYLIPPLVHHYIQNHNLYKQK